MSDETENNNQDSKKTSVANVEPTSVKEGSIDASHVKVPDIREENEVSIKDPIAEAAAKAEKEAKEQAKNNPASDAQTEETDSTDEEGVEEDAAPVKSNFAEKVKLAISFLKTKAGKITAGVITTLLLLTLLAVKACQPATGGALYRVCHAFLEQQITYPETIVHKYVEQYPMGTRIYYNHTDGFGQSLGEYIECSFESAPQVGLQLKGVVFNTIKTVTKKTTVKNKGRLYAVEQKVIDRFNRSYSTDAILKQEQPLLLPPYDPYFL